MKPQSGNSPSVHWQTDRYTQCGIYTHWHVFRLEEEGNSGSCLHRDEALAMLLSDRAVTTGRILQDSPYMRQQVEGTGT